MSDFGAKLRAAREQRGISLREIADRTKISKASLDALERGDLSRLPGGIFVRAFVRAFATEVGLDPDVTVREFLQYAGEQAETPVVTARIPDEETSFESEQRVARTLLRIIVASVPIAAVILYFTLRPKPVPMPVAEPPAAVAAPASAAAPVLPTPPPAAPAAAVPANAGPADTPVPASGIMELAIEATGPCWTSIVVDGRRAIQRTLQAGEHETLQVQDSVVIRVGDAGAFAFSINGRAAKPLGAPGEVRTANITKESMASFLR